MVLLFPRKTHAILGMDISATAVKILELRHINKRLRVQGFAVAPLMPHVIDHNQIKDPSAVTAAIQLGLGQMHFSTRHVAIAMPATAVISKIVSIDASLSEEELEAHVQLEAATVIPFPLDEVCMDFSVLEVDEKDPAKANVLVVAARRAQVDLRRNTVAAAGLMVDCIEVESFAIERVVNHLTDEDTAKTIAVIDFGAMTMTLTVIRQRRMIYTHEELLSMQPLTAAMDSLMPLLRRVMHIFLSSVDGCPVDQIWLSGLEISGLCAIVSEGLSLPTAIINPFHHMSLATAVNEQQLQREASAVVTACGLALRGLAHYDNY